MKTDALQRATLLEAGKTTKYDRAVLIALIEAAETYGRDVSDHRCSPTEHEPAFWTAVRDARTYVGREAKS